MFQTLETQQPAQSTLSDDTQQLPTQHLPVLKGAR